MAFEYEQNKIREAEDRYRALQQQVLTAVKAYSTEVNSLIESMNKFAKKNAVLLVPSDAGQQ